MCLQASDPCPSYPVTSYVFNITEQDSNNLTALIRHTGNTSLSVKEEDGLVPYRIYCLTIRAENSVGSTLSEEILLCKLLIHTSFLLP